MIHNWAYSVFIQCKFSKLHYTPALAQYRHALADSWLTKSINTCRRGVYRQVKANTVASMIFISQYDTGIGPLVWCLLGYCLRQVDSCLHCKFRNGAWRPRAAFQDSEFPNEDRIIDIDMCSLDGDTSTIQQGPLHGHSIVFTFRFITDE